MAEENEEPMWKLACHGLTLFINNRADDAKQLFEQHLDNLQMAAGYSFVIFMDALMSFEDDKLQVAYAVLHETEKKCGTDGGWIKALKSKMSGRQNPLEMIETQIILADTQICVGILTFLQQEFSSYIKGAWVLRKAWRIYQDCYKKILEIYKKRIGELNLPAPTNFSRTFDQGASTSSFSESTSFARPSTSSSQNKSQETHSNPSSLTGSNPSQPSQTTNGYKYLPHSYSTYSVTQNSNTPRSQSAYDSIPPSRSVFSFFTPISNQFNYLTDSLSTLSLIDTNPEALDPEHIVRLMGSVSFGYGILQLGFSLLPPALIRLINFFGFSANRVNGISHLMYARQGEHLRAPLATLTLLWYHTIVRPFYAVDGANVKAGAEAASILLEESNEKYAESALFLFYEGRVHRLNSDITGALNAFELAVENSNQREVKLLALHEVGWCHLIQLDYENAEKAFSILKVESRWSRHFYVYILIMCLGSLGQLKEGKLIKEMGDLLKNCRQKGGQLEVFLMRRLKTMPKDNISGTGAIFWKLLVYELLFLWNSLPSCNLQSKEQIIIDCGVESPEPMPGLAMLIQGECYTIEGATIQAIQSYRNCLAIRENVKNNKDDGHISAYAEYALGCLLLKREETQAEGKNLIQHAGSYKDFDFDNKLHVRIESTLRNL